MITLTAQTRVRLFSQAVDFRNGIDGLSAICRRDLAEDPFSGALFLFRNRAGHGVKILAYDGQGFWLCQKRLSQGRFRHWPGSQEKAGELTAQEVGVLLFNGDPFGSRMALPWRKVG